MNNNFSNNGDIRRILILGHTGFIGSHLQGFFHKRLPKIDVIGMSSSSVDLTKKNDALKLKGLFDLKTIVVMCAAIKRQFGDNLDYFSKNLKMIMNLCRVLCQHPVKRFIFLSSAAIYGEDVENKNITEATNVQPRSYYGMAKYISECLLNKVFDNQRKSSLLIMRPPLVYGPGEIEKTYGPGGFVKAAVNKEKITLWGDGQERREFIFLEDLLEITHRLTLHNCNGILNIVSGKNYTFREAIQIISHLGPFDIQVISRPRTKKKVDHQYSNAALMKILRDFYFTGLEEGIKKTIVAMKREVNANQSQKIDKK